MGLASLKFLLKIALESGWWHIILTQSNLFDVKLPSKSCTQDSIAYLNWTFLGNSEVPIGILTQQWNIIIFKRKIIFKGSFSHCYVSLPGCIQQVFLDVVSGKPTASSVTCFDHLHQLTSPTAASRVAVWSGWVCSLEYRRATLKCRCFLHLTLFMSLICVKYEIQNAFP